MKRETVPEMMYIKIINTLNLIKLNFPVGCKSEEELRNLFDEIS